MVTRTQNLTSNEATTKEGRKNICLVRCFNDKLSVIVNYLWDFVFMRKSNPEYFLSAVALDVVEISKAVDQLESAPVLLDQEQLHSEGKYVLIQSIQYSPYTEIDTIFILMNTFRIYIGKFYKEEDILI